MRRKDYEYNLEWGHDGHDWERAILGVLMDIRDRLNVLQCPNFVAIPSKLDIIAKHTKRAKRRRKK